MTALSRPSSDCAVRRRGPEAIMTLSMRLYACSPLGRLRLLSALVMCAYIAIHLGNHALGIVSLALAEGGLRLEMAFWRSPSAAVLLYWAAATHFFLVM